MRVVCISDTHTMHMAMDPMPEGDILVCAGDITDHGDLQDVIDFGEWCKKLHYRDIITIAGNHDFCFQNYNKALAAQYLADASILYLKDSDVIIDGYKIYGSPWQPWFYDWAFNAQRGNQLREIWSKIPDDVNVLITHGPPKNILDGVLDYPPRPNAPITDRVGCEELRERVKDLKDLKLHVFGHLHYEYGVETIDGVQFVNASICDDFYKPFRKPIVVDI